MSDILESNADRTTDRSGGLEVSPAVTSCDETASSLHPSREWLYRALLLLLIALAFARGVCGLGAQSLWWDESLSLQRANYDLPLVLSNEIVLTDAFRSLRRFAERHHRERILAGDAQAGRGGLRERHPLRLG